jgi:LysM repeat protein
MAYEVYLGAMRCPVAPSKIETKIKGQNKTLSLINDTEINVLKSAGLTEISFDMLLPNIKYPFAVYDLGFNKAEYFLNQLETMKNDKKPFMLLIIRVLPTNEITFNTQMKVSLEDYTIKDDVKEGFDITVSVKLKQYKDYGTKIVKIIENPVENKTVATTEKPRSTETAPASKTYKVVKGDSLWNIAKKYLGNGARYMEIYELNKDILKSPNMIYPGQVLKLPDGASTTPTSTTKKPKTTPTSTTNQSTTPKAPTVEETPPKQTAPQRTTVKIVVKVSGYQSKLEQCIIKYTMQGKTAKQVSIPGHNVTVDIGSTVEVTVKRSDGKAFGLEVWCDPAGTWTYNKSNGLVVMKTTANTDSLLNITWKPATEAKK